MVYNKAEKGIKKIFIAEIIQAVISVVMLLLSVLNLFFDSINASSRLLETLENVNTMTEFAAAILQLIVYLIMIIGIINASKEERKFRSALMWVIGGFTAYIGLVVYEAAASDPMTEIDLLISAVVMLIITLTVIDGILDIAENLRDTETYSFVEKGIRLTVAAYLTIMLFNVFIMIFTSSGSYNLTSDILDLISKAINLVTSVIILMILRRAVKMFGKERINEDDI